MGASISPTAWTYSAQNDGTVSAGKAFTFSNYRAAASPINYSFTGANADDFQMDATSTCPVSGSSIPATSNCTFVIRFAPLTNGVDSTTFAITDADGMQ
jgi:hypothetical protein